MQVIKQENRNKKMNIKYRKTRLLGQAFACLLIVKLQASQAMADCPCDCQSYPEVSGDYVLDSIIASGSVGPVDTGAGYVHSASASVTGTDSIASHASCEAYAWVTSDTANAGATASGMTTTRTYIWTGPPSMSPGAHFGVKFSGSGYARCKAQVSSWDATAGASSDCNASGSSPGSNCDGSMNLNSISGGITGISANASTKTGANGNVGAQTGDTKGFTFGGGYTPTGNNVATTTRTWNCSAQSSACVESGTTSLVVESIKSAITDVGAYANSWVVPFQDGVATADATCSFKGELNNLHRCDK